MASFFSKLKDGLKKTRNSWFDAIFGEDRIKQFALRYEGEA